MHFIRIKKAVAFSISAIVGLSMFFYACQKELTSEGIDLNTPSLTKKVSSSVSGFVTDENDVAVNGAVVTMGGVTTTDKNGFFEIKNVVVVEEAAVVTVTVPGYFKAVKTYLAAAGKAAFFRVKLLRKTIAGTIDATAGGSVTLGNGLGVTLAGGVCVNAANNSTYTGTVNVAAQWINPEAAELNNIMPGDLRGIDTAGALKLLTTYGMAAIELTGASGELLQIAPGKKATLTIPMSIALAASAPATIPLWYFDETNGLWKEQGVAIKSGNNYIGAVSHFSYWNCDKPSNYVRFNCTVTNAKGVPIQNAMVKISVVTNKSNTGSGYTDSSGYTSGAIPINTALTLEVFSEYNCLAGLYAKNFTTTTADISLGNIVIPAAYSATVTGSVVDCYNAPVYNGYVIMRKNNISFYQRTGKTGTFEFTTTLCSASTAATFTAQDKAAFKESAATPATLIAGANVIGTMTACDVSSQQFINYTVNGINYAYTTPVDSVYQYAKPQNTPPTMVIGAFALTSNTTQQLGIVFPQNGIVVNSTHNLSQFSVPQIGNPSTIASPITVKITEYGMVDQYIAGNFSGTITGAAPGNVPYIVTCSFRVKRSQ